MERIRFHPESCKWSKKKNQNIEEKKDKTKLCKISELMDKLSKC